MTHIEATDIIYPVIAVLLTNMIFRLFGSRY